MIEKWLHITLLRGDPWILPIWSAVKESIAAHKLPTLTPDVWELGLHISIRLDMLPRIIKRINKHCQQLYEGIKSRGT